VKTLLVSSSLLLVFVACGASAADSPSDSKVEEVTGASVAATNPNLVAPDLCYRFHAATVSYNDVAQGAIDIEWDGTTNQIRASSWLECGGTWTGGTGGTCSTPAQPCIDETWHACLQGPYGPGKAVYSAPNTYSVTAPIIAGADSCDAPNFIFAHIVQQGPLVNNSSRASIGGVQLGNYGHSIAADDGVLCTYVCGQKPCD
jgi:hypothetical protein